jgi:hypothetical protein
MKSCCVKAGPNSIPVGEDRMGYMAANIEEETHGSTSSRDRQQRKKVNKVNIKRDEV